jgi:hypothetical protein
MEAGRWIRPMDCLAKNLVTSAVIRICFIVFNSMSHRLSPNCQPPMRHTNTPENATAVRKHVLQTAAANCTTRYYLNPFLPKLRHCWRGIVAIRKYPNIRQTKLLFGFSSNPDLGSSASHNHNITYGPEDLLPEITSKDRQEPNSVLLHLNYSYVYGKIWLRCVGAHKNNRHLLLVVHSCGLRCHRFYGYTTRVTKVGRDICRWKFGRLTGIDLNVADDIRHRMFIERCWRQYLLI